MPLTQVLNEMLNNVAPPGVVLPYAGTTEPSGWLLCYGQAISHTVSGASASVGSGSNDLRASGSAAGAQPTTNSQGSGSAHNNTQPTLVLNHIIRT